MFKEISYFNVFTCTKLGNSLIRKQSQQHESAQTLFSTTLQASSFHLGNMTLFNVKTYKPSKSGSMMSPNKYRIHTLYGT